MCVFCKIVSGEFSSYKVYEDDKTIAILDLSQATKGHTLVIPKNHSSDITEISKEDLNAVINTAQIVSKYYLENVKGVMGVNLLNNNKEIAGQTVMHYHMHVIPRYKNDNLKIEFTDNSKEYDLSSIIDTYKVK